MDKVAQIPEDFNKIPRINWLASFPKSGNTWVRLLLYVYKVGEFEHIDQIKGHSFGDLVPGVWFSTSPLPWGILNNDQRLLLRYPMLMTMIGFANCDPIIIKTHNANIRVNSVDMIPEELTGRSVYLVRDPRDIVPSYAHHMGITIDDAVNYLNDLGGILQTTEELGIIQATSTWSLNVTSWLDYGHFKREVIKYEDLKENPEREFEKIARQYYKEEPDLERIKKAVEFCEFSKLKAKEQSSGFAEASKHQDKDFFRSGKVGTWKEILTKEQVKKIESDHGEVMERLGYKLEYL